MAEGSVPAPPDGATQPVEESAADGPVAALQSETAPQPEVTSAAEPPPCDEDHVAALQPEAAAEPVAESTAAELAAALKSQDPMQPEAAFPAQPPSPQEVEPPALEESLRLVDETSARECGALQLPEAAAPPAEDFTAEELVAVLRSEAALEPEAIAPLEHESIAEPSSSPPEALTEPAAVRLADERPARAAKKPAEQPPAEKAAAGATDSEPAEAFPPSINLEAMTMNMARLMEEGSRVLTAYFIPRDGANRTGFTDEIMDAVKTLGQVAEYWYGDPQRTIEMQARLGKSFLDLFASMSKRLAGEPAEPAATPDPRDKRFSDPEWSSNHYFDFIKQAYLIAADWAKYLVEHADTLDPSVRQRAEFYMRQIVNATAPSNFLFTNPVLLRTTLSRSAENLAHGAKMLAEDIEAGGGDLKIRQSDMSLFEVGRNLGITPGKVIYQNELMQLIQYAPSTERVLKRPLLIVPPWINKFYVLDLTPEKSFIKWCIDQGLTVFVISWINPDERHASKDFGDYMRDGPLTALDVIHDSTGEDKVAAAGYCVGGTLLAFTLAYMAGKHDDRIASATFLTTQVDFTYAGDLKIFASTEAQVAAVEQHMARRGYLEGSKMAAAFNLLRSNELIWPYVINNYMKGEAPFAFDLLYWNADSTRMPAANHSYYLRNCYLDNNLVKGTLTVDNVVLNLGRVTIPVYNLATREDHIAPAKSVYLGSSFFGGPMRYVLSGSGHIAGVVNPPAKQKYQYWTGGAPKGDDLDTWLRTATMHPGSWWPDWMAWLRAQASEEVAAREPGGGKYPPIEDAPGSYVKVRN